MRTTGTEQPVRNSRELQQAMHDLKLRIREREAGLEQRLERLPREAAKSAIGAVLPAFLSNKVAESAWKLGTGLFKLLGSSKDPGKAGNLAGTLLKGAKQVGFFAALRLLSGFLRRKDGKG